FFGHIASNEPLLKFDAVASSLTDKLVFNNSSLKTLLLLFYIALFYSTLYFISFVHTQKNMKKTTITLSAALFALLTMSCNNNPANNEDNHSVTSDPTQQASVTPVPNSPHTDIEAAQAPSTATAQNESQATSSVMEPAGKLSTIIPNFKFYKVKSGISYEKSDIPKDRKTMFILFDPGCSLCRTEASALGKNYSKFKDVNLLFVSMNDPALMATFLETFAKELV